MIPEPKDRLQLSSIETARHSRSVQVNVDVLEKGDRPISVSVGASKIDDDPWPAPQAHFERIDGYRGGYTAREWPSIVAAVEYAFREYERKFGR
jgi:hypothetical protein